MSRYCPSCNIQVEGNSDQCPLCQNELQGPKGEAVYPSSETLQKKSFWYKIQLFVLVSLMVVCLAMEFMLDIQFKYRWSLLVSIWVIGGEWWLSGLIKRHNNPSKLISLCEWWLVILIMCTFLLLDIRPIYFLWILPGIVIVAEILHFVHMMLDKSQNAMAYLLGSSFVCIAVGGIPIIYTGERNILWVVCIMIGIIAVIGAVIFKGRRVTSELEKRFHI